MISSIFILILCAVQMSIVDSVVCGALKGCLDSKGTLVPDKSITEISIIDQHIPRLSKDSIKNLPKLRNILISYVDLRTLGAQPFRNLPSLQSVIISNNKHLKEIPKDIFNKIPSIVTVNLSENGIDFIAGQAFADMPSLVKFEARENALEFWNREWFEHSTNLEILDFNSNKINTIPRRAFAAMPKLKEILLGNNKITSIGRGAFGNLTHLRKLDLSLNRLTVVDKNAFLDDISIDELFLCFNNLNFLAVELLEKMTVKEIVLDHNPWKCLCLDKIHQWILRNGGRSIQVASFDRRRHPVCAMPKNHSNTCIENVDVELTMRYSMFDIYYPSLE